MTFVEYDRPDTNFCEEGNMFCNHLYMHRHWWIYLSRPPEDYGKQFVNLHAWHMYPQGSEDVWISAFLPDFFAFDPCTLTWNTRPGTEQILSQHHVLGIGWYKFWVGLFEQIYIRIEFRFFNVLDPNFYGGLVFNGPRHIEIDKRPFFSFE